MIIPEFKYLSPQSLQEACAMLVEHGDSAKVLAGGSDLLVKMKDGLMKPTCLVSLKHLDSLKAIRYDSGTVINPSLLHAQVEGALFMGMGEAMYEEVVFDEKGKPLNANLGEYRVPTALDVPQVVSELVDSYEPAGLWGVKEVGEGATLPTMGCYANATCDAIGVRIYDVPLTPEKVWKAVRERKKQS